jgi:uncharacterized membrane protein
MRPARRLVLLAGLALLAGCGRGQDPAQAPPPAAAPRPAPAPTDATDFARPLNLLGNEPFWSVKLRPDALTFSAPDQADVTAPNPGPSVSGVQAVWTAGQIKATVTAKVCQDGMSGFTYPFTAVVEVAGRTLTGCGAYADAMPRE